MSESKKMIKVYYGRNFSAYLFFIWIFILRIMMRILDIVQNAGIISAHSNDVLFLLNLVLAIISIIYFCFAPRVMMSNNGMSVRRSNLRTTTYEVGQITKVVYREGSNPVYKVFFEDEKKVSIRLFNRNVDRAITNWFWGHGIEVKDEEGRYDVPDVVGQYQEVYEGEALKLAKEAAKILEKEMEPFESRFAKYGVTLEYGLVERKKYDFVIRFLSNGQYIGLFNSCTELVIPIVKEGKKAKKIHYIYIKNFMEAFNKDYSYHLESGLHELEVHYGKKFHLINKAIANDYIK